MKKNRILAVVTIMALSMTLGVTAFAEDTTEKCGRQMESCQKGGQMSMEDLVELAESLDMTVAEYLESIRGERPEGEKPNGEMVGSEKGERPEGEKPNGEMVGPENGERPEGMVDIQELLGMDDEEFADFNSLSFEEKLVVLEELGIEMPMNGNGGMMGKENVGMGGNARVEA